jgi:hypothetical protein
MSNLGVGRYQSGTANRGGVYSSEQQSTHMQHLGGHGASSSARSSGSASVASTQRPAASLAGRDMNVMPTIHHHHSVTSHHAEIERLQNENATAIARAEAAEDRLLRSMAHFSKVEPLAQKISAHRGGSAMIASVESRNELGQASLWDNFETMSPVQFLKAELKTPTETVYLERTVGQFEVVTV